MFLLRERNEGVEGLKQKKAIELSVQFFPHHVL